jgi:hypothetical protein
VVAVLSSETSIIFQRTARNHIQSRLWKLEVQQSGMEIIESNPGRQLCGHQVPLPLTCLLVRPVKFRCRRLLSSPPPPPAIQASSCVPDSVSWRYHFILFAHVSCNLMVSFMLRPSYPIPPAIINMKYVRLGRRSLYPRIRRWTQFLHRCFGRPNSSSSTHPEMQC